MTATCSSVEDTWAHDAKTLESLASAYNLSFTAFGKQVTDSSAPAYGTLTLSDAWGVSLPPAPITPTRGDDAAPFRLLAGTIKATHNAFRNLSDDDSVIVSPGIMSGNTGMCRFLSFILKRWLMVRWMRMTDTRYYWNLTKHIFRYGHNWSGGRGWLARGVHTVNEGA